MKKIMRNEKGQMALLMILVAALALVFLAITMNISRISGIKTMTLISADQAVMSLASQVASYGEQQLMVQLGGKVKVCKNTGLLAAVLTFIVVLIIAIVLTLCSYGTAAGPSAAVLAMAWAAVVVAAASVVLQATVIQPGLTKMWNKLQQNIPLIEDRFLESTLQLALQGAVSDNEQIRDLYDYNMNGIVAPESGLTKYDKISRFAYFYTKHLLMNDTLSGGAKAQAIMKQLANAWGLNTKNTCCDESNAALCNSCCVPVDDRAFTCHPTITDRSLYPEVPAECRAGSMPGYPLNFDPLFCQRSNPDTLAGILGFDDGNKTLTKADANSSFSREVDDPVGNIFRGEDSDGKLFPLLWMMADSAPKIYGLTSAGVTAGSADCHWCSADGAGVFCDNTGNNYHYWFDPLDKSAMVQLALGSPICSGDGCCTNRFAVADAGSGAGTLSALQMDNVEGFRSGPGELIEKPQDQGCPGPNGIWRKGADLYCRPSSPYYAECPKVYGMACQKETSDAECTCQQSPAGQQPLWHDDEIDNFTYWMRQTATTIQQVVGTNPLALEAVITDYYADAQKIIQEFREKRVLLEKWKGYVQAWLDRTDFSGSDLWCLPTDSSTLAPDERTAVAAGGAPYGSVQSVVNCLKYNSDNAVKIQLCVQTGTTCPNGPRMLNPGDLPTSKISAENADIKFKKRHKYVNSLYQQAVIIRDGLTKAINAADDKILVALQAALDEMKSGAEAIQGSNYLIYGWQSYNKGANENIWHLVKAEAWLPRRCEGFNQCLAERFPWVKTYKKGTFKRCYALLSYNGCVKVRVQRYDTSPQNPITLGGADKLTVWKFKNGIVGGPDSGDFANCIPTDEVDSVASGAFMVNSKTVINNPVCSNALASAFSHAIGTEVCASYVLVGQKYQLRFIKCNECTQQYIDPHNEQ